MLVSSVLALIGHFVLTDCQFLYPVDENPPNNPLTFTCYKCNGESDAGCADVQSGSRAAEECTGIRIGCWTTLDVEAGIYERTCIQPTSVRQGVFCNRHMEGREFCYYDETQDGLKRKCSKCCLNDFCNRELLKGQPDPLLQTCIECDGRDEAECNQEGREVFSKHMVEQCLMPNSDCWTARTTYDDDTFYTRGCQIAKCDEENVEESCSTTEDGTTCRRCCPGAEECNYGLLTGGENHIRQNKIVIFVVTATAAFVAKL